jgi:hypothetical protein
MNYYKDPEDGSPPAPFYVEYVKFGAKDPLDLAYQLTFDSRPVADQLHTRPTVEVAVEVTDISGQEEKYTLDSHGFQVVRHESEEKSFLDEDQIKSQYYKETEQLLKDV